MKPWTRHAQRYRARGTRAYSSLQRAIMAGVDPLALFRRRDLVPDGWQRYIVAEDPARRQHAIAGEIATDPCDTTSITGFAIAIATPGIVSLREPRDSEECAPEADAPSPRLRAGR